MWRAARYRLFKHGNAARNRAQRMVKFSWVGLLACLVALGISLMLLLCSTEETQTFTIVLFCVMLAMFLIYITLSIYSLVKLRRQPDGDTLAQTRTCPHCGNELRNGFSSCAYCNNQID